MAVDARVALKNVVAGVEGKQVGAFATAHIGYTFKPLAHIVAQRHVAALILAPDESHAIGFAVLGVDGHLVEQVIA